MAASNKDIYITKISSGEKIRIPLLPDEVDAKDSTSMISINVIATGEVKIPRGSKISNYSWNGIFPGEHMKNYSWLREWQEPELYIRTLKGWRENGEKLRLLITESTINVDVYIQDFTYKEKGGAGDYDYSLSFVDARTVTVSTVQEAGLETDTLSKMISAHYVAIRPANYSKKYLTHTVVLGDTLYSIAKQYLGDGNRWEEIYNLNKEMIDAANKGKAVSKDKIYVGQVLLVKENPDYVEEIKKAVIDPEQYYDYSAYAVESRSGSSSGSSRQTSSAGNETSEKLEVTVLTGIAGKVAAVAAKVQAEKEKAAANQSAAILAQQFKNATKLSQ